MNKIFTDEAWQDYLWWESENIRILKKINDLIKDIERNGNSGLGKPEPLRNRLLGFWSRRITDEHRLIYKFDEESIYIIACRGHYK